ncbi:MAG TPA: hypothetical protein DSN98_02880 [Thermoplasmata archaeon]|jgi:saccharopine dehydrogenase-like NADP-dependent oxidoreductase|nr:MAG TPA: hypothetical protein DSN98_02880 [Thermoplasmata archaeon]
MTTKIVILGGASGDVGRDLTRILLKEKKLIDHITVTARHLNVACDFVTTLDDQRVTAMQIDVTDNTQLLNGLNNHDLVVNTIGPFSRYAIPIVKAAIHSGVNYIDICDDIEPTFQALRLDKQAKKAGVFMIIGMGWFPGMSNLNAKELTKQMEDVTEIDTAWVAGRKAPEEKPSSGIGGTEHFFRSLTGKIVTFRNGQQEKIPAFQKELQIPFPQPLGTCSCYLMEHPEPVIFPLTIPGIQNASTYFSLYPINRNKLVRLFARMIDMKLLSVSQVTKINAVLGKTNDKKQLPILTGSYISCCGSRNGQKGQLRYSAVNTKTTVAEATSQPLACAILHLATHKIEPGVYLPENILNIEDIIKLGRYYELPFAQDTIDLLCWNDKVISP